MADTANTGGSDAVKPAATPSVPSTTIPAPATTTDSTPPVVQQVVEKPVNDSPSSAALAGHPDVSGIDFDAPGVERPDGANNYLHANPNNIYPGGRFWFKGGWVNGEGERLNTDGSKITRKNDDGDLVPVKIRTFDAGDTPVAEGVAATDS